MAESTTKYCGYLINDAFLAQYAREKQLPPVSTALAHAQRLLHACDMFINETLKGTHAQTVGVYTKSGKLCTCIALASDNPEKFLPRHPQPEDVALFKAFLKRDTEPRWFRALCD